MFKHVTDKSAMGFLSTKPTMLITTLHESGIVNAGVFGAYTNLSPTQIGVAISTTSHTYANIIRTGEFVINVPEADIYCLRLSFPVFIRSECESFPLAGFAIPANISFVFGKSLSTPV